MSAKNRYSGPGVPVALLLRLSSTKQVERHNSSKASQTGSRKSKETEPDIPTQREEALKLVADHPDWVVVGEYLEPGVSAWQNTMEQRAKMQEILADARNGAFKLLLVWTTSRVSRLSEDYPAFLASLQRVGVTVWSVATREPKPIKTRNDKLMRFLEGWQAEGESESTSLNVRARMRQEAEAGRWMGGTPPFGYRAALVKGADGEPVFFGGRVQHELEANPDAAHLVGEIFRRYVGGQGMREIASWLLLSGVPTVRGGEWDVAQIRVILSNPMYKGLIRFGRTKKPTEHDHLNRYVEQKGRHPALVDDALWERAQEVRRLRNTLPVRQRKNEFPLSGLLRCPECGGRLGAKQNRNVGTGRKYTQTVLLCRRHHGNKGCGNRRRYPYEAAERQLLALLEDLGQPSGMLGRLAEQDRERREVEERLAANRRRLEVRLKEVEAALVRLEKAKLEGEYEGDIPLYQQLRHEYRQEREQVRAELGSESAPVAGTDHSDLLRLAGNLAGSWTYLSPAEQKQALMGLLEALDSDLGIGDGEMVELRIRG